MKTLSDQVRLNNGMGIPCVGFGTWQTPDGEIAAQAVREAVQTGYRHIDTAACYNNEPGVGEGIKSADVKREELFVTSKVWNTERGYDKTRRAFEKTLKDLDLEYLDLYLIHWPASASQFENWEEINLDTWKALTELYKEGLVKAVGVSNFMPHHLKALMETEIPPMVNQIEFHPGQPQEETVEFCEENDIAVEAWSPLGSGRLLDNAVLNWMADKYGKSAAQICIRWCLQKDVIPLPKSVNASRIKENADVFDFKLSPFDVDIIDHLPAVGRSGLHPDEIDF